MRHLRWTAVGMIVSLAPGGRPAPAQAPPAVQAPVLKWASKGCTSYCETGWYGSPAVADLDGDGQAEVVWAPSDLVVVDGATGTERARVVNTTPRAWPGVVVADIDGDGSQEIVVARSGSLAGTVRVHRPIVTNGTMTLQDVWSASPFGSDEVRSLAVDDLDGNGTLETIVGRAGSGGDENVHVYESSGAPRAGWPAPAAGAPGYGSGLYNQNLAVADLDGNGARKIFAPPDNSFIAGLNGDGSQIPTHARYDTTFPAGAKVWRQVGVHVDDGVDLAGFSDCNPGDPRVLNGFANFAYMAPAIGDFDGNGTLELAFPADAYDCSVGSTPDADYAVLPFVLNRDRSRWAGGGHDWTVIPTPKPGSAPLSHDFNVIEASVSNAVIADLDGDGERELLYAAYDGRVHAWWMDKTQHGNWPYTVPQGPDDIRFAGEPVVADLNGDGQAEVIFTSWGQKDHPTVGKVHVLDSSGNSLFAVDLPVPAGGSNGGLAAPTIANIDADPDYELVVGTIHDGLAAYDLPGSAAARIQWGTGRGSLRRTGLQPEEIFSEDFELGVLSRWSSASTDGGNLSVSAPAALSGAKGLQAVVNDTNPLFVQDDGPDHERRYRARFSIDPNGFDPGEAAGHFRTRVFIAFQAPSRRMSAVVLKRQGGFYSVMGRVRRDDGSQADTGFKTLPNAPGSIEIDLRVSSASGASDGRFELFVNGASVAVLTGIDNDAARVDFVRMGALSVKGGAAGTLFFDRFASQRRSRIGS